MLPLFAGLALALPVAADARTAVIIGDSQAQGLNRPLTAALEEYDVNVVGTAVHQGYTTNRVFTELGVRGLVSSRNPDLIIVIVGGNDTVGTSEAQRSAYEGVLNNAIVQMGGNANIPKIVWVGPAFSRDEGVQARHDRTASAQQAFFSGIGVRWIDGRTGSRAGPYQQDSNPGTTESQIRNRNTHLTNEGYRRWACELAPQLVSGSPSGSCPTAGGEGDIAFDDIPGDVAGPDTSGDVFNMNCDPNAGQVPITLGVSIAGVTQVSGLPQYINTAYRYLASIVLVIAIVMVVYGGFLYLTGAAGMGSVQRGKQIIRDALIGMVIVLSAYAILNVVNPNTTNLSLNPPRVECEAITHEENADEGGNIRHCVVDSDCREGRVCLRTTAENNPFSMGQCTEGLVGELCRCGGSGCDVREVDGVPTNNNGIGRVDCQVGTCRQAGSGGIFDSSASGNWVCNSGMDGSQCNNATEPPVTCAAGYICEQRDPGFAGRCVAGDNRDQTLDPRPVCSTLGFGPSGGERYYQETNSTGPFQGGCNRISGDSYSPFCITNRYRCSNTASNRNVCSEEEFAVLFGNTGNAYNSGAAETWDFNRPPQNLQPWSYARFGCRKPIGASCTADSECSSMCVNGTCTGFCAIRVRDGSLSLSAGANPPRDQLEGACTTSGCGSDTWSAADFAVNFRGSYLGVTIDGLDVVSPMTIEKAACYPTRPNGSKCDFNGQCQSGTCRFDPGAAGTAFPSFSRPLDMTAGIGTCSP